MTASIEARIAEAASPLPLPAPSLLLPLPATSHKEDVPEADSSAAAAAAARQPGSSVARRADYSFVDTVDVSIRAAKERAMAIVRVVNLRVSYQADVRWRKSEEFYTCHQDAQDDRAAVRADIEAHNRALEARIATMETQLYRLEWQRQDADDYATRAMMRIHVLKHRAHIDTLKDTGSSA
ncbi:hypothetical protein Tco_0021278 [Tanacetum coccineum]